MSTNYGFEPTLDGLNTIDADSTTTNNIICDTLLVNTTANAPTPAPSSNNTSIATTAFVQNAISTSGGAFVSLAGNRTLTTGVKTFTNLPECSAVPTSGNQLVNKDYVDNGVFVNLTGDQTISGNKTFTATSLYLNDNGINTNNGFLAFQDSSGDGAGVYYNNDDTAGSGGLRVVSSKYGFAFSSTTGAGEHCDFLSQDVNLRATDSCNFTELAIPPPTGGQSNQVKRGSVYDVVSTAVNPTVTITNGTQTDSGVIFTAMTVNVPAKNTCNMVSVKIAFDLIAWATFGLAAGSGTIGLQFNSYTLTVLKNGGAYTPAILSHFSNATGTTQNWTKTGTQTNISGLGAYFGTINAVFNVDINNATADTYAIRITPTMTITFSPASFDGFKFSCRNSTSGATNGNPFFTGVRTSYTGGTLTYASSVPTFVDSSLTRLANSYPAPPTTSYCFMPNNNNITPPGMISAYLVSTPPPGWLICNGTSYSITTYPNLYAVIGNTFGGTFATGVFSVPDFEGAFLRGAGSSTIGGVTYTAAAIGTAQQDQVLNANQSLNGGFHNCLQGSGVQSVARFKIGTDPQNDATGVVAQFARQGTENRPFNYSVYYIIKY